MEKSLPILNLETSHSEPKALPSAKDDFTDEYDYDSDPSDTINLDDDDFGKF